MIDGLKMPTPFTNTEQRRKGNGYIEITITLNVKATPEPAIGPFPTHAGFPIQPCSRHNLAQDGVHYTNSIPFVSLNTP